MDMLRVVSSLGFSSAFKFFAPRDDNAMDGAAGIEAPPGVPGGVPFYLLSDSALRLYGMGKNAHLVPIHGSLGQRPMFWGASEGKTTVSGTAFSGATTSDIAREFVQGAPSGVQNLHLFCFFDHSRGRTFSRRLEKVRWSFALQAIAHCL